LIGHLLEMCEGAGIGATVSVGSVPTLANAREILDSGVAPGGTKRNLAAFRSRVVSSVTESDLTLMCDAQTSGGLLIAISSEKEVQFESRLQESGLFYAKIGSMTDEPARVSLVP
jgi:selenide,water dikinase